MKRLFANLALAFAYMSFSIAYADEHVINQSQNDECLLSSKNCKNTTLSLRAKITKIKGEINKGTKVYTTEELKKLRNELKVAEAELNRLKTK